MKKIFLILLFLLIPINALAVCQGPSGCYNNVNSETLQGQKQVLYDGSVHQIISEPGKIPRSFAVPGNISFPGYVNHFDRALTTGNVFQLNKILSFKKEFALSELQDLVGKEHFIVNAKCFKKLSQTSRLKIYLGTDISNLKDSYEMIGVLIIRGKGEKETSIGALGSAGVNACKVGANAILITGEGASRIIKASAWGLMLGNSIVSMSSDEKISNISVGGVGYASSKAGYKHIPWLQVILLKSN